jgi:hypothetical protein
MKKLFALLTLILLAAGVVSAQTNVLSLHSEDPTWSVFVKENMCLIQNGQSKGGELPVLMTDTKVSSGISSSELAELVLSKGFQPDASLTKVYTLDENHVVTVFSVSRLEVLYKRDQANKKAKKQ